ncbi:MAG: holo-ACP synthase [Gemmiger sp.]|uniref:holo-ACP synthase n=1 Tax=Gemmiger sp. TaxID=2049027 RepID=UPI002E7A4C9C|nr:holo-ACP synthase [Gemmiger sp.]MEE0800245.1 holo-ACP synthase [Gemmiger sp.]
MIYGIGTDLCRVERMEHCLARPAFVQRVFAPAEQQLLDSRRGKARLETAAANFAAKEAFLKACGTGLAGYALQEIAVLRRPGGAPYLQCSGRAADFLTEQGLAAHLSLTHEAGLAAAFVVLEFRTAADD